MELTYLLCNQSMSTQSFLKCTIACRVFCRMQTVAMLLLEELSALQNVQISFFALACRAELEA